MLDFTQSAPSLAVKLLGCTLIVTSNGLISGGVIIETEAYDSNDPASHSYIGPTKRNAPMFGEPGSVYLYYIYGKHICLNIVCGNHDGQAVLIRALKPTLGIRYMKQRRGTDNILKLCNGPANLVQALGIEWSINGRMLDAANIVLTEPAVRRQHQVLTRVGISKAKDTAWRFVL